MDINLPHKFEPRPYQLSMMDALDGGIKRIFCTHHRRAGKDITLFNMLIKKAFEKVGIYYYLLPTYVQAKRIIWDGITNDGFRFMDYIPEELVEAKNGTELKVVLVNGSIIQLIGTDNYDAIRGTNPIGCVFSEYAFQNPMAWEVVKPILKVNGGWAVFNTTPNGKNHAFDMFEMASDNDDWFSEKLTIDETNVLSFEDMEEERKEGMTEEMIQQEYYCSFDIGTLGAYYTKQIQEAREDNRLCGIPHEKGHKVSLFLDLGASDSTAILFVQRFGKEIRFIDHYETNGEDIAHYAQVLKDKDYDYDFMYLPHDAFAKRLESPKTIAEQFESYGFKIKRVPKLAIESGIQLVRKLFPNMWFDKIKCKQFIRAIENYHHEYDEVKKVFRNVPFHDWSSHSSDALRYSATAINITKPKDFNSYKEAATQYVETDREHLIRTKSPVADGYETTEQYKEQANSYLDS